MDDDVDEEDDVDGEDEVDEADDINKEDEVVVEDDLLEKGKRKKAFPKYRPSYHDSKCHAWLLCVLIPTGMPDTEDWLLNLNRIGEFKINMIKNVVLVFWD